MCLCYHPQNKVWGMVMFLHLSVSHSVHSLSFKGCLNLGPRRGICLWIQGGVSASGSKEGCLPLGLGCTQPEHTHPTGHKPPDKHPSPLDTHTIPRHTPWINPWTRYRSPLKQAVHILLECIIVKSDFW